MNKQLKTKWVKALESGKYRKTRHALSMRGGFCCLGVLCEVTKTPYKGSSCFLPDSLEQSAGIDDHLQVALASLNDGDMDATDLEVLGLTEAPKGYVKNRGAPFSVVAAVIRERL